MATAAKKASTTSTAVAVKKTGGSNIVSIKEALAKQAAALNERIAPASGVSIQIKDKQFVFPDGTKSDTFEGVIVDFASMNAFYPGKYDPKNIVPPACFAIGTNPLQLVPSKNSPELQADTCQECPNNEFGSSGEGKACKNQRKLAILPPDADKDTPIWTLNVSPTALKAFDSYVRSVANVFGMPPVAVVTTFSLDPNLDYPSVRFGNPVANENLEAHFSRQDEARKLVTAEPDVSSYQKPAPARKVANAKGGRRLAARFRTFKGLLQEPLEMCGKVAANLAVTFRSN
jgi:hypothetical protein